MAAGIQDALLLQAQQDAANRENNGLAITAGALVGSLAGVGAGAPVHLVGRLKQRLGNVTPSSYRPGARMAGGLVGAILGGSLGAGIQNEMMKESPAARYLAKLQMGGDLSLGEQIELEDILTKQYSSIAS